MPEVFFLFSVVKHMTWASEALQLPLRESHLVYIIPYICINFKCISAQYMHQYLVYISDMYMHQFLMYNKTMKEEHKQPTHRKRGNTQ